jgi:hypothetical protein
MEMDWRVQMTRPLGVALPGIVFAVAGIACMVLGLQVTAAVTFGPRLIADHDR